MRQVFFTAVCVLVAIVAIGQERRDSKAEIYANIDRSGGVYCPYPEGQTRPAKPPKGYKPFYLSHMGRHGSRYILGSTTYTKIYNVLADAAEKDNLAPEGEKIWAAYRKLYPSIKYREGDLTKLGQEQERRIASQIFRDYKRLFRGKTRAEVLSTDCGRVIVSAMCFLDEMRNKDKDFTYSIDYGRTYYQMLVPESSDGPLYVPRVPFPEETLRTYDSFAAECFDEESFLKKWFINPDDISENKGDFVYYMRALVEDFPNLDFPVSDTLKNIFSADDRYHLWQVQNYSDYLYTARVPGIDIRRCLEMSVTVKDIIDKYEEDTAAKTAMRLRFSHDTALMPLLSYLGVNGMDVEISDPHELEYYWRNYDVPMACNLQIVFFKNKRRPDDVLIQVLLNGFQATLPLEEAAPGFYRWADFKERFNHLEI